MGFEILRDPIRGTKSTMGPMTWITSLPSSMHDMTKIEVKGIAKVTAKGRTYFYAWRGGPRLHGEPGSPQFVRGYNEAVADRYTPEPGRFKSVIIRYRGSNEYKALADSTRRQWGPWLDRIADYFGELRTAQFNRPEKIRKVIRRWRNQWAATPRTADYGMQVLSRVCAFAVDPLGEIAGNPCEGIAQLYSSDRSEIIWTAEDIGTLKKAAPLELAHAIDLAACTGLRLGDLLRLSWSHIVGDAISLSTSKSRGRREALIPLYDELLEVLARIPKRSTIVLTNARGRPWTTNGIQTAIKRAKARAGMSNTNLHFHDLRGTAATKFYVAGLSLRVIAEILAWDEDHVEKIVRRYVGRWAATREVIRLLSRTPARTNGDHGSAKPAAKPTRAISSKYWSGRRESNPRHSAWEADVLPLNYARRTLIPSVFLALSC
jgi:integrase